MSSGAVTKRVEAPEESSVEEAAAVLGDGVDADKECVADQPALRVSKRQTTRKRRRIDEKRAPNRSMYVGYVEDGETVEMIMKKFEKLEEIKSKNEASDPKVADAANNEEEVEKKSNTAQEGLSEDALQELFNETSTFTVEAAVRSSEDTMYVDDEFGYDEEGWELGGVKFHENEDGEMLFLFGDGTDDDIWDEVFGKKKRKGKGRSGVSRGNRIDTGVTHIAFVSDMHGRFVTGLKKIRKIDPNAIIYQRIPNEISVSWAKRIEPYRPRSAKHKHTTWRRDQVVSVESFFPHEKAEPENSVQLVVDNVFDVDLVTVAEAHAPFEGIVLSPPWKSGRNLKADETEVNPNNRENGIEPEDLVKLGLKSRALLKSGFVYVWTPKHLILRVLRALEKMDFHYVENAVFVKQHVHNAFVCEPSRYFRQSKETLLICRRGTKTKSGKIQWEKVEIRHQRTSDVHFEFLRTDENKVHLYPHSYVHNMAETMLPHARFNPCAVEGDKEEKSTDEENPEVSPAEQSTDKENPVVQVSPGKLLHLWANPSQKRTGWVTIAER
mmetsp:Transcript_21417/g.46697  ORF Transcript_21417/g.46697 Transcript_21417/m.46697 type:complete len:553 (-) Transcript_21417:507-2165(-)